MTNQSPRSYPIIGIVGWKNSGKTQLTASLIAEFTKRGKYVSSVKHAHHHFDIDQEGTDSFRHREAGAKEVALVSNKRWALMHESDEENEIELADILAKLEPADLILVEGFKQASHPKIEIVSSARQDEILCRTDSNIIAIAHDGTEIASELPQFHRDAIIELANFIEEAVLR